MGALQRLSRVKEHLLALFVCGSLFSACEASVRDGGEQISRTQTGDTLIVALRVHSSPTFQLELESTLGEAEADNLAYEFGSVGALTADSRGNTFVYDLASRELRRFDVRGRFTGTIGRVGGGPGEFRRVSAMATRNDVLVISDPWSGRLVTFGANAEAIEHYRGSNGAVPMQNAGVLLDRSGRIVRPIDVFGNRAAQADSSRAAFERLRMRDSSVDSIAIPGQVFTRCPEQPHPRFRSGFLADIREPYIQKPLWGTTPEGELVAGCPSEYRFDILRASGEIVRIVDPTWTPVIASREEIVNHMERWTRAKRESGLDPDFSWEGANLTQQKPAFGYFLHDHVDRIWVWIPQPSVETTSSSGRPRWSEPPGAIFDIFTLAGDYIGRVQLPRDVPFEPNPRTVPPAIRGDTVWAVTRDSLGIERVARFRLTPATSLGRVRVAQSTSIFD